VERPRDPPKDRRRGLFGSLAGEADRFVQSRLQRFADVARAQTDELAQHAGENFARQLVDQVAQRIASKLALASAAAGALVVGVWLVVAGLSGALGEAFGKPWAGQLVAGATTIVAVAVAAAVLKARRKKRKEREEVEAALKKADAAANEDASAATQAAAGAREGVVADAKQVADVLGKQAMEAGGDLLRRHPLAGAAALSAAGILAGTLLARANGRTRSH
jgi:hypothetical protein